MMFPKVNSLKSAFFFKLFYPEINNFLRNYNNFYKVLMNCP